jgi:hypothetical protein
VPRKTLADVLARGAERDDHVGLMCIEALARALDLRRNRSFLVDTEETDDLSTEIGVALGTRDISAWIPRLLDAARYDTLRMLAGQRDDWPLPVRRALSQSVLPLIVALDGPHRSAAAFALGDIAWVHREDVPDVALAVPRLCELLVDAEARYTAAQALGSIRDARAIEPLLAALAQPGPIVPIAKALRALDAPHVEAAAAIAAALVQDRDPNDRKYTFSVLAQLDPHLAARTVAACADPDDTDESVLAVAEVGARDGDPAALDFLERVNKSTTNWPMRRAASEILTRIRRSRS